MTTHAVPPEEFALPGRFLHGPVLDGLLLGGASIVAFLGFRAADLGENGLVILAAVMMLLANFVNHPHFAHSYQIFYGSFSLVRDGGFPKPLAWRWWWAGCVAPGLLALWLGTAGLLAAGGQSLMLALSLNLLAALVGWHYVKQGFGMAMVDAALKRRYWRAPARRALLVNAYVCWGTAWALGNDSSAGFAYWGYFRLVVDIPGWVLVTLCLAAAATTCWCGVEVARALGAHRQAGARWSEVPWNGLLAYVVTLYLWTLFAWIDVAYLFVIPFFHSLQYLTVVWRYKQNELRAREPDARAVHRKLASFTATGIVLGALGFWLIPGAIEYLRTGVVPISLGATAIALACAWIFINIHHYLIDNVLWRQGNPNVNRYLFQQGQRGAPA